MDEMNFESLTGARPKQPVAAKLPTTPKLAIAASNISENYKKILATANRLDRDSKYRSSFDYSIYDALERRFASKPIRGGVTFQSPFKLVNSHATCQQCLYTFEIDTYGRGCAFNCAYCYAKAELIVHGYWNAPIPVPVDINVIRKVFYTVFETNKKSKWRSILEKRIPLRIGSMSDSFMPMDKKYGVTKELLRILKFYDYPYIIFTRSDVVSHDEYLKLMNPKQVSIQMSISSINDELNRKVEPGAPSAKLRLQALKKVAEAGFWTTVRVNPLFPIYPDGYFTNPKFKWEGEVPRFDYTSFDMVAAFAEHKIPAMLAGFARFSSLALNGVERTTGMNLRQFYDRNAIYKSKRDWHYSDAEIRYYYDRFKFECLKHGVQFTTCYIGNGESHFWMNQDLWSNKTDCCNAKMRVPSFGADSREIPFQERLKFTNHKSSEPTSTRLHEPLGKEVPTVVPFPTTRKSRIEEPPTTSL